ncbi:MAG: galactokinase [Candidatus Izemoplasmatales bacterium]|jgi:galactokinase|nr:galactokinase [Candidatus Izemoplasmatales bacterium]
MSLDCKTIHQEIYPYSTEIRTFFSPGRVNLIGEHIDYNGGYVMPFAISNGNAGCISIRLDQKIAFYSSNFSDYGIISSDLEHLEYVKDNGWANYAIGIIYELKKRNYLIPNGFDISITGNLPTGAGLSSSASIEALVITMMNECFHLGISKRDLSLISQYVENNYIHVNCGIMDQFVILNGIKDHALLLNTSSLEYKLVPMLLTEYEIVICNSLVKRGLVGSKYNERRQECDEALVIFQKFLDVSELCQISPSQFEMCKSYLGSNTLVKRSRHAVYENYRTIECFTAFNNKDYFKVGRLLTASHESLKDDYEVSCYELDLLVELALQNGSIGSRMTGAGFGGCTVSLVNKKDIEGFKKAVKDGYYQATGLLVEILVASVVDGTKEEV